MKINKIIKSSFDFILMLTLLTSLILLFLYLQAKPVSCSSNKKNAIFENYSPTCTISGNYLPYQKWKNLNFSWCVTNDGIIIPETYKKISNKFTENENYYNNPRFNECLNIRKNMNINQRVIVLMGKIFNPYVS